MGDNFGMEFHTLKGYQMHNVGEVTESMEDYLEMIGRCMEEHGYVRVGAWPTSSMSVPPRSLRWSAVCGSSAWYSLKNTDSSP